MTTLLEVKGKEFSYKSVLPQPIENQLRIHKPMWHKQFMECQHESIFEQVNRNIE
jgi:hypothetical protein